jgi:hypothetical protein
MKKVLPVLVPLFLLLGFAATGGSQSIDCAMYNDDGTCADIFFLDPSDPTNSGGGSSSGTYYACQAKGSWGGSCTDCVTTSTGAKTCALVFLSASCQCDKYCTTSGSCTYMK